jgi:glycosyltransferase involved in cell wall biosynthesis
VAKALLKPLLNSTGPEASSLREEGHRVLFIATYPEEVASTRFRVTQFFPYLESNGIRCTFSPLFSPSFCKEFYRKGAWVRKGLKLVWFSLRRLLDVFRCLRCDVAFVQRESHIMGPPVIEWIIGKILRKPIVFDFDDPVFVSYVSPTYGKIGSYLKMPQKTGWVARMSSHVIVCTHFSKAYAERYNSNVSVIPTVVDAEKFIPTPREKRDQLVIGWIGSFSSASHFKTLTPVFERLGEKYRFVLKIVGLGCEFRLESRNVTVLNLEWSQEREIGDYQSLDIGVYPLIRDPWSEGKMGMKVIGYMAVGIPCVCSPVGDHVRFLRDGENGMLASAEEEWFEKLSRLIEDERLRQRLGAAARKTVVEWYCLQRQAPRLLEILNSAAKRKRLLLRPAGAASSGGTISRSEKAGADTETRLCAASVEF